MKPTPSSLPDAPPVLAFGAHPDDIEFGGGGVIAQETRAGRAAHFVVGSRGEAATHGRLEQRVAGAQHAAALPRERLHGLGAAVEYATALFPADPLVFNSLSGLGRGARGF